MKNCVKPLILSNLLDLRKGMVRMKRYNQDRTNKRLSGLYLL